jgi:Chitin binding Peritrophin-A domain
MHTELIILISILYMSWKFAQLLLEYFSTEVPVCEPNSNYTLPHFYYCDRYFSCVDGFVHEGQCADGYAYEPLAGCIYSHFVDCTSRPLFRKWNQYIIFDYYIFDIDSMLQVVW